jgi:ankyrin repeat protein
VLRALIEAGADPHVVSELGYNVFHAAVESDEHLEDGLRATLSLLVDQGVDIEHRDQGGRTPLARAIAKATAVEVQVLTELGADPNAAAPFRGCSEDSCSADPVPLVFHAIRATVHPDKKLEALLRTGARLDILDTDGLSPLEYAKARREEIESWSDTEFKKGWLRDLDLCVGLLEQARAWPSTG